jgi:hypothetical protein
MRRPTIKDIAVFYDRALESELCRESEIVEWADSLIVDFQHPIPDWLLELSTNRDGTKASLLAEVPGESDEDTVWNLISVRLSQGYRNGYFTNQVVVRRLYLWTISEELPDELAATVYQLDHDYGGVVDGWNFVGKFESDLNRFLSRFQMAEEFFSSLDCWVLKTLSNPRSTK